MFDRLPGAYAVLLLTELRRLTYGTHVIVVYCSRVCHSISSLVARRFCGAFGPAVVCVLVTFQREVSGI